MSPAALPFEALAYTAHTTASTLDTVHILSTTILGLLSAGTGVATWWLTTRRRIVAHAAETETADNDMESGWQPRSRAAGLQARRSRKRRAGGRQLLWDETEVVDAIA